MRVKLQCGHMVDSVLTRHYNKFGSHIEVYGCPECNMKARPNFGQEFGQYLLDQPHILKRYFEPTKPVKKYTTHQKSNRRGIPR